MSLQTCFMAVVAMFVAMCNARAEPPPATDILYRLFNLPEGHFRCELPRNWGEIRDKREESRTHCYGTYLVGPKEAAPLGPTLSARYFAPDNSLGDSAEKYLRRQLEPGLVPLRGEKTSAPESVKLDGRSATKFTRDTFDLFPPDSLEAKQIPIREEYYVVPYLGGFVVLKYAASTATFLRWHPAWQRLLDTFQFLPEE